MSTPATAEQLNGLLGEIDPIAVEHILATGATMDEVVEALASLEDEAAYADLAEVPSSPKVAEVRDLLAQYVLDDRDDIEEAYGAAP